ncbi:sulfite exporter TauE/SafE family protein [Marinomonas agarivorans]|nr:sulfite exporter TauE/SafE family protein [Marinomonas agarivorans]
MEITLISTAFIAGILNGIGSSGGMLFLSIMLLNGFHPVVATATNKVIALIGSLGAIKNYWQHSETFADIRPLITFSVAGVVLGSLIVLNIEASNLGKLYTMLTLCLIILLFCLKPIRNYIAQKKRLNTKIYYKIVGMLSGIYNGFFGPGTIIVTSMQLNMLDKYTEKTSLSTATILNTVTNAVACIILGAGILSIFELNLWLLLALVIANVAGQYFGSLFIVRVGEKCIEFISKATLIFLLAILVKEYWL